MNPLELLRLALLVAHFVGMAAVIGPFIMVLGREAARPIRPMLVGSIVQLATGILLILSRRLQGLDVIDEKMIVKAALALLVLAAVVAARFLDRRDRSPRPALLGAGWLAVANVAVAAVWT